ncbi:MAG: hypothetical protein IVW53_15335 [Chloroflexi bacterium]|nr:hypothetical protein [Chloroflexota bacterium]
MRLFRAWSFNVLVAADELLNAISGGDADGTISLRLARAARRGSRAGRVACRLLSLVSPHHCARVLADEEGREQDAQGVTS